MSVQARSTKKEGGVIRWVWKTSAGTAKAGFSTTQSGR